jgi:hypothetical protein
MSKQPVPWLSRITCLDIKCLVLGGVLESGTPGSRVELTTSKEYQN